MTGSIAVGDVVELDVGAPAHGGSCVARHDGRVVFVRHAIPGERVRAAITDVRDAFLRADAVEVLNPSPDRVEAPCPYAGPGRCGGCDWQHVAVPRQRALKRDVIIEQFRRIAHLDVDALLGEVEALPGGPLGWRTRITYAIGTDGVAGLHPYRSSDVLPIQRCLLGAPGVGDSAVLRRSWSGLTGIEVSADDDGPVAVLAHRPGHGRHPRGRRPPDRVEVLEGPGELIRAVGARRFAVAADGFWQVHPAAAATFAAALLDALALRPGESVVDLYCGAGALTAALAGAVGPGGQVIGVEADATAVAHARANLADLPQADVRIGRVDAGLVRDAGRATSGGVDVAVVDPPRAGLGRDAMTAVLDVARRAVGYVACDPASLARDVAVAVSAGWQLSALRAFDAFPMTHHVECVALLTPSGPRVGDL